MVGSPAATTVVVADDHPVYLESVGRALAQRPAVEVVGLYAEAAEVLAAIRTLAPDVAVVGERLPGSSGIDLVRAVKAAGLSTRVVLVTHEDASGRVYEALRQGAAGVLTKSATLAEICEAVETVATGGTALAADAQERLVADLRAGADRHTGPLTPRERGVLELIAAGLTVSEIARRLDVAPSTVKSHVKAIYSKLLVNDRASAVAEGMRQGYVR